MKKEYSMKLFWIGFLGLMLCIPLALISNLADERRQRREAVALQLGRVWGGAQLIAMPFLSKQPNAAIDQMSFSSNVDIKGKQSVEIRKKGTYQIPFYNLDLDISGKVSLPASKDKTYYLVFPVSSLLRVSVESAKYGNKPIKQIKNDSRFIAFKIVPETDEEEISYELKVKLTGMEKFHILPMANNIRLEIDSNWGDPSFTGRSLPDTRTIDKNGFTKSRAASPFLMPRNVNVSIGLRPSSSLMSLSARCAMASQSGAAVLARTGVANSAAIRSARFTDFPLSGLRSGPGNCANRRSLTIGFVERQLALVDHGR
jgi:inner membrane protein